MIIILSDNMISKKKKSSGNGIVRESPNEYGAARRLSATEAVRNFSELLNRVRYRGETFIIERGGEAVGELRPAASPRFAGADLLALLRSLPPVDEDYLKAVEEAARSQPPLQESPWEP
jgi:antitoxin (DNA-binding transcriptional repressor) of toxin-antitoxin stability system